jgi:hypothetical protein
MPLSIWLGMEDCLQLIVERRPKAVLDAGIGFGLWGGLLRQYLDVWSGRIQAAEWTTRIDGIEIDERRVLPHARHLYTEILVGDIRNLVPRRAAEEPYDVILFGDVIEHLPKADGRELLDAAVGLASQLVVVRIPLGDGWRREGREQPDHHRSRWYAGDFSGCACTVRQYDFYGNPYGLVTIEGRRPSQPASDGQLLVEVDRRLQQIERRLEVIVQG